MTLISDPHGQAALMLCESFAYLLIEHGTVSKHQVIDAIEGVIEIHREIAEASESVCVGITSILLLQGVVNSIRATSEP